MIESMFNFGSMQSVERTIQFTAQRQKLLVNNVANLSTPHFRPTDVRPEQFQAVLRDAIDRRRSSRQPGYGSMSFRDTSEIDFKKQSMALKPDALNDNILFHDRNNRDLDRTMQAMAENTLMHRAAVNLMRNQIDLLRTAIRERM